MSFPAQFEPNRDPEFKGHIHAREIGLSFAGETGEIVDGVFTLLQEIQDVLKTEVRLSGFERAARNQSKRNGSKYDRVEETLVFWIERTVDEDRLLEKRHRHLPD